MTQVEWFKGRLKELREKAGLTREQLSDAAGLGKGVIRDLEQGHRAPSWETVLKIAAALGVSCEAFTSAPADREAPGRGRPPKAKQEKPTGERAKAPKRRRN